MSKTKDANFWQIEQNWYSSQSSHEQTKEQKR